MPDKASIRVYVSDRDGHQTAPEQPTGTGPERDTTLADARRG
jgi:hypothetical protein